MSILSGGTDDFFGLDISPASIQLVQLKPGDPKTLLRYASLPVEGTLAVSDSKADWPKLAAAIDQLIKQSGVTSKNVAVGIPSNRVFTSVIDMDKLPKEELAQAIRFQADSIVPTPLAESKIDWALLGPSPRVPNQDEVILTSVPNDYVEGRLDLLESIGLNVLAFEPNSLALVRSLLPPDVSGVHMILEVGTLATDMIITINGTIRLARSIPTGISALIRAASSALGINATQASQFVHKFGLSHDKLEGQVYEAIIGVVDNLIAEAQKSVKFFAGRYPGTKLDKVVLTGGASTLPEFPLYVANKLGLNVEIGYAWANVAYPPDKQSELMGLSYKFAVAAGLAERE